MSTHFSIKEATHSATADGLGIDNSPDEVQLMNILEAMERMEEVRSKALDNNPVLTSSWLRVAALNKAKGYSTSPRGHVSGWCVDFTCPEFGTPLEICLAIIASGIKFDQLIYEGSWVHISFHPAMRNEILTAHFSKGKKTEYVKGLT